MQKRKPFRRIVGRNIRGKSEEGCDEEMKGEQNGNE
jgi:hypothetical protein